MINYQHNIQNGQQVKLQLLLNYFGKKSLVNKKNKKNSKPHNQDKENLSQAEWLSVDFIAMIKT